MTDPDWPRYQPDDVDKNWAKMCLGILAQGAVLAFPSAKLMYRVDHKKHRLVLLDDQIIKQDVEALITHEKTKDVFAAVGYDVIDIVDEI